MYGDEGSEQGPPGTFETYRAEGDILYKNGEYKKAIESYSTALEIRQGDKDCLVARSKCNLQLGDTDQALNDAQASLSEDPHFHKGLYQKAEALYCKGEFELALVFYHRGHKLRPELQEFRLGIQKAQEAIDNSVGSPEKVTLTKDGDLKFFEEQTESKKTKGRGKPGATYGRPSTIKPAAQKQPPPSASKDKTVKQMLGELYGDRIYLEKLLKETDPHTETGRNIYDLVCDGLTYLDTRTDFWRQQKPMYARRRERVVGRQGRPQPGNVNEYIVKTLTEIDDAQAEGRYEESLKKAKKCLSTINNYNDSDVDNKQEIQASLHSSIGNAYLETGDLGKACQEHQLDLDLSTQIKSEDGRSRALDNLGRVYARQGDFQKAIDVWSSKLSMTKSDLENTWLYHEIGRCHLELGDYAKAQEYGEKALEAAKGADDDMWQLNSAVLVAQSEVKLEQLQAALGSFERALDMAQVQGDKAAEDAIRKAMEDVNRKIVASIKAEDKEAEGKPESESEPEPVKKTKTPSPEPEPEPEREPTPEPEPEPEPEPVKKTRTPSPEPEPVPEPEQEDNYEEDKFEDEAVETPKSEKSVAEELDTKDETPQKTEENDASNN